MSMRLGPRSSMKQPKEPLDIPPIFVDRCLVSKIFVARLSAIKGLEIHVHDDYLPQDADDDEWIQLSGKKNWIALTHDFRIRYKAHYWEAVKRSGPDFST